MSISKWHESATGPVSEHLKSLSLVDHHVHGVVSQNPSLESFSNMITESDRTPKTLDEAMNTQIGFATRKWCAPLLDLPEFVSPQEYFNRRIELGAQEVNKRLLHASGIGHYLIETGYRGDEIHGVEGMAQISAAKVSEVIRLETVAEKLALTGVSAKNFAQEFVSALKEATKNAVGIKSIVAYRIGLDFDPSRPSDSEVEAAASKWLAEVDSTKKARIADPVLMRFLLWAGSDTRLPFQFHIGFGDPDLYLHKCDPLLMTDFIRQMEKIDVPVMLLHTYPFTRNAGYLAQMFRNVYLDVGLAVNYAGTRSEAIIAESIELAPFHKILFSSDAWGLPELTFCGSVLFRKGLGNTLDSWVAAGDWSEKDAINVATAIGQTNALNAYSLNNL
jgi:predicted TIM-barrel fold metal-dependent hydrolase